MKKAVFQLETLTCPSCVSKIEATLTRQKGVSDVRVLFNSSKVRAQFDERVVSAEELSGAIEKIGYPVLSSKVS